MNRDARAKVEAVIMETLKIDSLPAGFRSDMPLSRLEIDSVLLLEIIVTLETELGITIADESLNDLLLSSIDGLVQLVETQREQKT